MVGSYAQTSNALELRRPAAIFAPLAWLIAGPLNPAGFFADKPWNAWDIPFTFDMWAIGVAIPLSIGCAGSLFYLREGGFGGLSLALVTALVTLAACGLIGPLYTLTMWMLWQLGIDVPLLPVFSLSQAVRTSGTFIVNSLFLMAVPIIPAIVALRLIGFRREKPRPPR